MDNYKIGEAVKQMNVWRKVYNVLPRTAQIQLMRVLSANKSPEENEKAAKKIIASLDPISKKKVEDILHD